MPGIEPWNESRARAIIGIHAKLDGATLPVLHALMDVFGCIPLDAEPLVADALNLSRAEIHGVVTFYHDFRRAPPGRRTLRICRAEACQAVGAEAVATQIKAALSIDWHGTTADGEVTLEPVFCLGLCASGPAALLDNQPLGRMTARTILSALG